MCIDPLYFKSATTICQSFWWVSLLWFTFEFWARYYKHARGWSWIMLTHTLEAEVLWPQLGTHSWQKGKVSWLRKNKFFQPLYVGNSKLTRYPHFMHRWTLQGSIRVEIHLPLCDTIPFFMCVAWLCVFSPRFVKCCS